MSSFTCQQCQTDILDSDGGYLTGCPHWPIESQNQADAFNEKAGMFEFEFGLSRSAAEIRALQLIKKFPAPNGG